MKKIISIFVIMFLTACAQAQSVTTVDCKTVKPVVTTSGNTASVSCPAPVATPRPTPTPTPTPVPTPTPTPVPVGSIPTLPAIINFPYPAQTGKTLVANSSNLQSIIDSSTCGDIVMLTANTTYTGNFVLPKKACSGWVVIRTSTQDSSFVVAGTRVHPSNSALMPKVISPNSEGAFRTDLGASGYRFVGIEMTTTANLNYGILKLGDGSTAQNSLDKIAGNLVIDRCYIHGNAKGDVSRGIALNSNNTAVTDSYISEIHAVGSDTQAIGGWNGGGPYKIVNNYLEGAGENFMLGGADPHINGLIPSDVEFVNNHVFKPLSWKVGHPTYAGIKWSVKNLFELKNAKRVLVNNNVFENNWDESQEGFAVLMKSVNQDGTASWSQTADVTFTNNIIRNSGSAFNLLGTPDDQPGIPMTRVLIKGNTLEGINSANGGQGKLFQISGVNDLTGQGNISWFGVGDPRNNSGNSLITTYGNPSLRLVFTDNTVGVGEYGVKGDGKGVGTDTLNTYFPGAVFTKNKLVGANLSSYPAGNTN